MAEEAWDGPVRAASGHGAGPAAGALIVDVAGYEGPLDLLLALARSQKVDLRRISVLALAEQYLAFIGAARELRIELAADYLVTAAWLAYLKSRLLLPPEAAGEEPSAEEMAAHLAFQLERLEAMRDAAARLLALPRLGQDRFARGAPQPLVEARSVRIAAGLVDLLRAYARVRTRDPFRPLVLDREPVLTPEEALERLRARLRFAGEWRELAGLLPEEWRDTPARRRSATAATFAAALELVRQGRAELAQEEAFAPLRLRRRPGSEP
ncbi:MAG: segregation/condensation protein A [Rhodobacteraceae bacterium]|jgi:segregation and condensation protein A|nr:segregation/condensation protein A [Paracoccaceae bacterium]